MKTAMPAGLMSSLQLHAPSLAAPVKMKLKPGDSKLMSNQINRTAPAQAAPPPMIEKDPFGKFGSAATNWADSMGRELARTDMEKAARAEALEVTGAAAGEALAKMAGGLGAAALNFAKNNKGATIGAGLGLLHGTMNGGIGTGLMEAGVGAGAGYGVEKGVGMAMNHPDIGPKMKAMKDEALGRLAAKRQAISDKGLAMTSPASPRSATMVGVAPQKTIMGVAPPADVTKLSAMNDELAKIAFGAALANIAKSAIPAITNFVKTNPLKAGMGAASAVGNFVSARKNGEGLGSSLISGATGAASAL